MVEAIDVTPPTQAVVATDLNNATKQLSGTSDENGAKIFVKVNDQWLKDAGGQAVSTTVSSGKWLLDLPKYLTKTDKVDIYVKDTTTINPLPAYPLPDTYTQEPDGVFGNINVEVNEYENYQGYHDAVKSGTKDERFNQAKRLTVNDVLPDKPGLAKTAKSSGGETTSIGDVITYTLKVSNNKADSQDWKNIQLVDKIPEGLIFDPLNHGITISGSPVGGNRFKYDDQTRTLTIAVGNISAKKLKTITFNATVSQNAVVGQDIINIAEANGDSPQEKPFVPGTINPNSEHESISVKSGGAGVPGGEIMGSLSFISAPTALDFGVQTEKLNGKTIAVEPTIVGEQLVVSDNRKDLKKWTMFAAVLTPLANGDTILPSAIHYVNGNSDEVITGLSKEIFSHTNKNAGEYNISEEEWEKKGNGFKVELPPGAVNKLGKYQATIQFTLSDAY
nr:isopeptide-forming domain-containing fimbrial protein [Enterococcus sp. DIV0212c]